LPGGGTGVRNLKASADVEKVICDFNDQDKWILAICAAPLVLSKAGILVDRTVTCFPGCEAELVCNKFLEDYPQFRKEPIIVRLLLARKFGTKTFLRTFWLIIRKGAFFSGSGVFMKSVRNHIF
jgi:putative intracellular protease/amidase